MSAYTIAKQVMAEAIEKAAAAGHDEQALARALMSEVIAVYKKARTQQDIASELNFLANNLDDDEEYAFMRP
ncbi:MAG: hypothetical protein CMK85_04795 [Pseudomonadales bacterium]|mgnify:CR=1 FL=1|jgi:hypothetical protein|uniref:Uncharacterized protein n=1 Tax=Halopseudomonas aestusnigri TaxID=857252 RepID=A0AAQ1G7U5_9GAMM|nr:MULTISPECIES: hypothetical protein [Halopseudomonas]MAD27888.1 hypothetical protein [Pseudomonadales bacterium]MEE2798229.1 hypothetical protein [Pseudomonadota bacterium]HBT56041.1 hypothetical protein [Pseudomonas sp.]MAH01384.1 hypothetical protein [Pseudomonadales bacterium]MAK75166.1 hypothetical protein [Pseudomonadales bacterium]|tara:strand:- start:2823 stop:3038 length:216 start_codon:yes stop_codon:yes gene_type:complete